MPSVIVRDRKEIDKIRQACRVAADVLDYMARQVRVGITTYELDQMASKRIDALGAESACLNYRSGQKVFPCHTCISINEEIVHGVASIRRTIQAGDIVSLDVVVRYNGFIGDNARTVVVDPVSVETAFLVQATREALHHGISFARVGNRVGQISHAIQRFVESRNLSVVRNFVGHGVGKEMHEEPQIPNFGKKTSGPKLREGMTLAIEPMVNMGSHEVEILPDGWTAVTRDRQMSAHFEHTIHVSRNGPEILTLCKN